jgi:hypothetical protein
VAVFQVRKRALNGETQCGKAAGSGLKKKWGRIFILDFAKNTDVIHKEVGPAQK